MNTTIPRLNGEEVSSQSSDEKMDTGSESIHSMQNTPVSNLSSDYEDPEQSPSLDHVLRLQNPQVLRLSEPEIVPELSGSLIANMNGLHISSPVENRPKHLFVSPKFSSTLTSTTNHPLMGLSSPDENYPDLIPKKHDEKDVSLSSIENETSGYMYSPQRNTSKNNLYFNENFVTADSILGNTLDITCPPDVARGIEKRKRSEDTPRRRIGVENKGENGVDRLEVLKIGSQSTPKRSEGLNASEAEEFHTGVIEWADSPSQPRAMPNRHLPVELKTSVATDKGLESPDVMSSQEDHSAYQALLDPHTGSVALRHTPRSPGAPRRRIQLPPEDDQDSLDSASLRSLESDAEPEPAPPGSVSDDQDKRSTNTISECSEPIPEYSAAEELRDERSWLTVQRAGGIATCDMKVIEPYKRVVSHGGYDAAGAALIVFSGCHLPDVARRDYRYVMDNLFLYVIWTLERLVTDEYVLVYLYGSAGARRLPTVHWLREYYKLIDRRLRKSLKHLYVVHPTYGLKLFVAFTKAFISSKFFRKLSYVRNLSELMAQVPVEPNAIPDLVKQYDAGKR